MIKKTTLFFTLLLLTFSVTFISANGQTEGADKKITLNFVTWDFMIYEYLTETNPISELYKQTHPNVEIEIEKSKDTSSFEQTMQIRTAAGELPDILLLKPYMLDKYKDLLTPLNDHPSVKSNKFAEMYAIDGNILGLPTQSFNEFVYFRKSIYKELGLSIPKTWGEYTSNLNAIKADGRYIPLIMGLKDSWTDYPFNEYMPYLQSGSGNYYNEMAGIDKPFTKGMPFYEAYSKLQNMYDMDIMGKDPLGLGFDQAKVKFAAGDAAMMAAGQWFIADYDKNLGGDMDDLGIFYLPVRDNESDKLYATVMADSFFSIPKDGDNVNAVAEFIEWYFDVYYEQILPVLSVSSTVKGIEAGDNPILSQISDLDKPEFIVVAPDGAGFTGIKDDIQFDVKAMGQEMYSDYYKSINGMMDIFNKKWSESRQ